MKIIKGNVSADMTAKQNSVDSMLIKEATDEDFAIEVLIRERYSMSKETALHRKQLMGTLPEDEWSEYCAFVEECIEKARESRKQQEETEEPKKKTTRKTSKK